MPDETTQPLPEPRTVPPPPTRSSPIPQLPQWAWALTVVGGILTSGTGGSYFGASAVATDVAENTAQLEELEERLDERLDDLDDAITELYFALIRYDPNLQLEVP